MTWRGMDTETVQALAEDLRAAAERVQELGSRLQARMADTAWVGQDATRFREDWDGRLHPTLGSAQEALATAATIADALVRNQAAVSD